MPAAGDPAHDRLRRACACTCWRAACMPPAAGRMVCGIQPRRPAGAAGCCGPTPFSDASTRATSSWRRRWTIDTCRHWRRVPRFHMSTRACLSAAHSPLPHMLARPRRPPPHGAALRPPAPTAPRPAQPRRARRPSARARRLVPGNIRMSAASALPIHDSFLLGPCPCHSAPAPAPAPSTDVGTVMVRGPSVWGAGSGQ